MPSMPVPVVIINPPVLTLAEAAAYLAISAGTLYQWRCKRPDFAPRAVRVGSSVRFRKVDLDAWLEEHLEAHEPAAVTKPEKIGRARRRNIGLAG